MTSTAWQPPQELPFHWHVYDVGHLLPAGWDVALLDLARGHAVRRVFRPTMATAREVADAQIPMHSVDGEVLRRALPWTFELYSGWFKELGERTAEEKLQETSSDNRALSLNIQDGITMRYPCHVDSNPMQGLLYLTTCTEETGGGLVVARDRTARDVAGVDADAMRIYPTKGQLYFFDARRHAHYVEPLRRDDAVRAVLTMNYYSPSCPETVRPAGLDEQLFSR